MLQNVKTCCISMLNMEKMVLTKYQTLLLKMGLDMAIATPSKPTLSYCVTLGYFFHWHVSSHFFLLFIASWGSLKVEMYTSMTSLLLWKSANPNWLLILWILLLNFTRSCFQIWLHCLSASMNPSAWGGWRWMALHRWPISSSTWATVPFLHSSMTM